MTDLILEYAKTLRRAVLEVINIYGPRLITMAYEGGFRPLWEHFTGKHFSLELEHEINDFYLSRARSLLRSFIWLSEQTGVRILGRRSRLPRYLIVVDPIDTTEMACRGLAGYTHVSLFDRVVGAPVVSIVGDFFHFARIYVAVSVGSVRRVEVELQDGRTFPLQCSKHDNLTDIWLTAFATKPRGRYDQLYRQHHLISTMSGRGQDSKPIKARILTDFGSIGLCHIAAGFTDAMIELEKGFSVWDLLPGQHILETAGGFVTDPDGRALRYGLDFSSLKRIERLGSGMRRRFIAAGTWGLIEQLRSTIIRDSQEGCVRIAGKEF